MRAMTPTLDSCDAIDKLLRREYDTANDESAALQPFPVILNQLSSVMAGLVPAIHVFLAEGSQERRGCPRQARA